MASKLVPAALGVAALALTAPAKAEIVTFDYSGTISNASVSGLIPGSGSSYVGQTISGAIVLDTSQISGQALSVGDIGPNLMTMMGSNPSWLTATASIASRGFSTSVSSSNAGLSGITYGTSFTAPTSLSYIVGSTSGTTNRTLSLWLGGAETTAGFRANGVPGQSPYGTGYYSVYGGTGLADVLTFTVDSLTSEVADANGPGYTDPNDVPITETEWTIEGGFQMVTAGANDLSIATVAEPPAATLLAAGLALLGALGYRRRWSV